MPLSSLSAVQRRPVMRRRCTCTSCPGHESVLLAGCFLDPAALQHVTGYRLCEKKASSQNDRHVIDNA
eukprot:1145629-Pelagomonas_calceolata.AAC.2